MTTAGRSRRGHGALALVGACAAVACTSSTPDALPARWHAAAPPDAGRGVDSGRAPPGAGTRSAPATGDAGAPVPPPPRAPPDAGEPGMPDAGALPCRGAGARFATHVVSHAFGPGQNTGQDDLSLVLGPPKGGGADRGSTDTVSLGNGGWMVLEFGGNEIVDGPGADFIVFENPFRIQGDPASLFAELGTVAVSEDGATWSSFPCTAVAAPYGECSGWHVVFANADTNAIDPTDPSVAGGDAYDLAELGLSRARYVRITDRPDLVGMNGVYDLDAVSIVHPRCP